jgi:FkbM family methyltransferase
MDKDLIFDVGLHVGQDTAFYLKKGYRVVAVEANPELCQKAEDRFHQAIQDGRLLLVNKAITSKPGPVTFYRNLDKSVWGTVDPAWAERNIRLGTRNESITVEGVTIDQLLRQYGVPYYLKIDIEGLDMVCVEGLTAMESRPRYVSIESTKDSFPELRREIDTFLRLGYDRFKIVNQERVPRQVSPNPAQEGQYVDHRFEFDATGLFGEEAPGRWLSAEQTIDAYRPIFLRYALLGDEGVVQNRIIKRLLRSVGLNACWYDTHARLAEERYVDSAATGKMEAVPA